MPKKNYPCDIIWDDGIGRLSSNARIHRGWDIPTDFLKADLEDAGFCDEESVGSMVVEQIELRYIPRIKHCAERLGGFGCEEDGYDFHSHWVFEGSDQYTVVRWSDDV